MNNLNFAGVFKRVKASIIDVIILMMLLYSTIVLFDVFEGTNLTLRTIILISTALLYEPIMVSCFGASIGHMFCDLRVIKKNESQQKISLPVAIARFVTKSVLGTISLLTITSSKNKRAIHDMVANSIVIYVGDKK